MPRAKQPEVTVADLVANVADCICTVRAARVALAGRHIKPADLKQREAELQAAKDALMKAIT